MDCCSLGKGKYCKIGGCVLKAFTDIASSSNTIVEEKIITLSINR